MLLDETDSDAIAALLVGRRIVSAEIGTFWITDHQAYDGKMILDDGTELYLLANDGCGGCTNGYYELVEVAKVDNIITSAGVEITEIRTDPYEADTTYSIYVIADNTRINVADFQGDDGNGYYGTGFKLFVAFPGEQTNV